MGDGPEFKSDCLSPTVMFCFLSLWMNVPYLVLEKKPHVPEYHNVAHCDF